MDIKVSRHARIRQQQRCISDQIVDWLIAYGEYRRDGHGCFRVFLPKRKLQRLRQVIGREVGAVWHKLIKVYLVLSAEGQIVTVGYRH